MGYGSSGKREPFRCAVGEGLVTCHKEVVELLIAEGANVNAKTNDVVTPLDWVISHPETADLLRKHGGKTSSELRAAGN